MRRGVFALIALFFLLYVALLGFRPMVAPDETRYGEIPRELLTSGDWVVPHLNGVRYFEKPIMGYWLNGAAIMLFGENAFAVRLPSALAVGLAGWLLFVWARKFSEDRVLPLFATAIFFLSFLVFGIGTFAVLDSMLSLFTTAAVITFFFACQESRAGRRFLFLLAAGAACGCALLTKGFIALVIPASVILPFALWQRQLWLCLRTAWIPLLGAIAISLPWSLLIHGREPDFWHYFFWVEHVNRFVSPSGGQHPKPFWFYLPILLGGAMPWTVLAGPIAHGLRQTGWKHPLMRLAICWLVFPFLFFSACGGKLGTYILPCFPPVAFLIAVGVVNYLRAGKTKGFMVGARILMALAGVLLVGLVVALFIAKRLPISFELWQWAILVAGVIAWGVLSKLAADAATMERRLVWFCAAPVLIMLSIPVVAAVAIKTPKGPGKFLQAQAAKIPPRGVLVAGTGLAASVCWFYERSDVYLYGGKGEYEYGLDYEDSRHRFVDLEGFQRLLAQPAEGNLVTLIVTANDFEVNAKALPPPVLKEVSQKLVFAQFTVPATMPAVSK